MRVKTTAAAHKPVPSRSNLVGLAGLVCIALLYIATMGSPARILLHPKMQLFKTLFIGILLEALPFILIGVVIAALLHVFVTDEMIRRLIPANPLLGILTAAVLGIIFPICECGMVPAIRNLIRKGMPIHVASTFILVGPILNPIVFWSTMMAFRSSPQIAYARMGLAFLVALITGLIVYRTVKKNPLRDAGQPVRHHDHSHHHSQGHSLASKAQEVMGHAVNEFFGMGKYLLLGAALVGLLQTFVSSATLVQAGQGEVGSTLLMMGLGFLLSLCSTSDAFVAQSFVNSFSASSLIAFMVLGPMINLKGLLMMLAVFRTRFVILLVSCVILLVLAGALVLSYTMLK